MKKMGENKNLHTLDELKTMQNLDLASKIQITKARIIEYCNTLNDKTYISFYFDFDFFKY
jgi:pimeloyl-CoA synthetase